MYGGSPFQSLGVPHERHSYIVTPHAPTSFDPHQWSDPLAFNAERYRSVPTSDQVDEAKLHQIGLAKCPFDLTQFNVADGRKASVNNSGFGTVFGVVDGKPLPVCDHAGFAPFGFGYRRCPGEQLTIQCSQTSYVKSGKIGSRFQDSSWPILDGSRSDRLL